MCPPTDIALGDTIGNALAVAFPRAEPTKEEMTAAWEDFKATKLFAVLISHLPLAGELLACEGVLWGVFYNGYLAGAKR